MTPMLDAVLAFIVAAILNAVIIRTIRRRLPGGEGAFLARVYTWTLLLRVALACFLNAYSGQTSFADMFWGDSSTYDAGGWIMSMRWAGDVLVNPFYQVKVSGWGFFYFVAAIYYVFGHNQLLAQFINGTIGAVTVIVLYAIAKDLFDVEVAQWTARFMAFFPQMVFWSGAIYKDPATMLCIACCMYSVMRLSSVFSVANVVLFVLSALTLMTLRFYVFYFVGFATMGTFVLSQRRGVFGSLIAYLVLFTVFFGAFTLAAKSDVLDEQRSYLSFERLQLSRSDQVMSGQSAFGKEADVSSTQGALATLPTGLVYLLFAPFPWSVHGLRQTLTVPETLVWYALWPALLRGLFATLRDKFRYALPILVFAASLTVAYAIFQGNVGTAYRQRTQVTMFYFIFMAAGVVQKRRARASTRARLATPQAASQLR